MIDAERVSRNDAGRRQHEASRETKAAKSVPWCLSKFVRKARVRSIGIPQMGMKVANCVALARQSCGQHRHGLFVAHRTSFAVQAYMLAIPAVNQAAMRKRPDEGVTGTAPVGRTA